MLTKTKSASMKALEILTLG